MATVILQRTGTVEDREELAESIFDTSSTVGLPSETRYYSMNMETVTKRDAIEYVGDSVSFDPGRMAFGVLYPFSLEGKKYLVERDFDGTLDFYGVTEDN